MSKVLQKMEEIEKRKDNLVKWVESICNRYGKNRIPESTQLQNLRTVTFYTSSIEEIKNYIKYQMGRIKEWRGKKDGKKFGQYLIEKIEEEKKYFQDTETALQSIRLLTGYLIRYAKYFELPQGEGK